MRSSVIHLHVNVNNAQVSKFIGKLRDLQNTASGVHNVFSQLNENTDHFKHSMSAACNDINNHVRSINRYQNQIGSTSDHNASKVNDSTRRMSEGFRRLEEQNVNLKDKLNQTAQGLRKMKSDQTGLNSRLNDAQKHFKALGDQATTSTGRINHSFDRASNAITRHNQRLAGLSRTGSKFINVGRDMSLSSLGLGASLLKGSKDAMNLQQSYVKAGNMAHYGGERITQVQHDINDQWKVGSQLSEKYGINQNEIADGYKKLVARGYTTNEALHAQKSLVQASIASGDQYNDVVGETSNVLDAYNMRSNNAARMTNNTKEVTNQLAYAADQTATNFKGMAYSMGYVAATAHTTHQSISETSSALGVLANKGMNASMAGTGLRKVLNSFLSINKSGQQAQVMKQLGLTENDFKTPKGNLKSLSSLMSVLNDKTKNMDAQQRGAVFHRFFGSTGQEAALNLASDTKGLSQLNDQVAKSQNMHGGKGYVAILSGKNMRTAQNQLNQFKTAWQAFSVSAAKVILPTFTNALRHVDVFIYRLNNIGKTKKEWLIWSAAAVAAVSPVSFAIGGVLKAFGGVSKAIESVRKMLSHAAPSEFNNSIIKQASESDLAMRSEKGAAADNHDMSVGNYSDAIPSELKQSWRDHPHLNRMRIRRQRLGGRIWAMNKSGLSRIAEIGGTGTALRNPSLLSRINPLNKSAHLFKSSEMVRKPSMIARLNPLNSSARLFTHAHTSWIPGIHRLPIKTGLSATNMLRGSGTGVALRAGGSLLGKVNAITGIATSLPLVEKGLKMIDKTRIGGKIFGPFNKSLIKGMNGPVKFINRSWKFIKRGFFSGIRPIEKELHKIFGGTSKASRSNLRGIETFTHVATSLIGGLWRTIAKVLGNVLKYGGKVIADAIKGIRGAFAIAGGAVELFIHPFKRGIPLILHGINLLTSGIGGGLVDAIKGLGAIAGNVLNSIWSTIKKILSGIGDIAHFHPIKAIEGKAHLFGNHAAGGAITSNELSLVNERGQESAYNPHTNSFRLLGNNGPQVLELHAGEHVLDANDTRELLTSGLGKGVTLPGYANGTDKLNNLQRIHGHVNGTMTRGRQISHFISLQPKWLQTTEGNLSRTGVDVSPASALKIPGDIASGIKSHSPVGMIKGAGSAISDMPGVDFLKSAKLGKAVDFAKNPMTQKVSKMGSSVFSHLADRNPLKHVAGKILHKIPGDFSKIKPALGHVLDIGKSFGKKMLVGPISRGMSDLKHNLPKWTHEAGNGIRKFGRGSMRIGRSIMRKGGSLLRSGGRKLASFGRTAWSGAKRLGRNLWSGTRRIGRRMWSSARRIGRNIWSSTKRIGRNVWSNSKKIASNVGRSARSLWNRTKRGASNTWSNVVKGASRMASRARSIGGHAWSAIKSGASSAKSFAESAMNTVISWAHRAAHAVHWALTLGGHLGHHANGGAITHNQLSLVGEHGPETAYNPHNGTARLLGTNGPQITELLSGEQVLTNTQTNRLLHGGLGSGVKLNAYANGTNPHAGATRNVSRSLHSSTVSFNGRPAMRNMRLFGRRSNLLFRSSHVRNSMEWRNMSHDINDINGNMSKNTNSQFKDMHDKVGKISNDMKDGLIDTTKDTVKGFHAVFAKMITYAKDDMESVISKLNKGVRGIDVALSAFGGNSHVIHEIHYATGTMNGTTDGFLNHNQIGILNDATSGPRQESILRDGRLLFPHGDNVHVPLRKGDAVLNGTQTQDLVRNTTVNHYASGSGIHLNMKHLHSLINTIKLALKGPSNFFKKIFSNVVGGPSGHQLNKGIEQMGMEAIHPLGVNWTKAMFSYINSLISDSGSASNSAVLNYARDHFTGKKYSLGANGPTYYDCSGLVDAVMRHFDINLPRTTTAMESDSSQLHYVGNSTSDAKPGDLVLWGHGNGAGGHVGFYEGNNRFFSDMAGFGASSTPLNYVTALSRAGFWRIKGMHNTPQKKAEPRLERLVKSELGSSAIKWLSKTLAPLLDNVSGANNPGGSGVARWKPYIIRAAHAMHADLHGASGINKVLSNIFHESGGNPTITQTVSDINSASGHPAQGLVQFVPSTFEKYAEKGHNNIKNGYDQLLALFNDSNWYSDIAPGGGWGPTGSRRYANGGWAYQPSIFGEAGPEVAINPRKPTADRLIMSAISARIRHNPNSKIASLIRSINLRHQSDRLQAKVNNLLFNRSPKLKPRTNQRKSININISFGNIVINGASGNSGVITNKVKRAIQRGVQKASYEAIHKLGLD